MDKIINIVSSFFCKCRNRLNFAIGAIRKIALHICKAWPVLIPLIALCIHIALVTRFGLDKKQITNYFSFITQLSGVGIILYSIDSNIGLFDGAGFKQFWKDYLNGFKSRTHNLTAQLVGSSSLGLAGTLTTSISSSPKTLEEKIAYLQRQIDALQSELKNQLSNVNTKIEQSITNFEAKILKIQEALDIFQSQVKEASTGGWKWQVLGVVLILYSAGCDFYINLF